MDFGKVRKLTAAVFAGLILAVTGASAASAAGGFEPDGDCPPEWCDLL